MAPTNTKELNSTTRRGSGKYEAMRRRAIAQKLTTVAMDDKDEEANHADIRVVTAMAQAAILRMANIRHCKDSIPTWIFISRQVKITFGKKDMTQIE